MYQRTEIDRTEIIAYAAHDKCTQEWSITQLFLAHSGSSIIYRLATDKIIT